MVDREQPHPRQAARRAPRRPRHRRRMGRDRARSEEGAVRHPPRRVRRGAAREPRHPRARRRRRRRGIRSPGPHRVDLGAHARHVHQRDRRAEARRAREARRPRGEDRLTRRRLGGARDPDRRRLEPRQAHGLALPRPASSEAEPHLPHPDDVPARAAHLLGRARLRRDPDPEAHGERLGVAGRAVRGRLLRGNGVPRPEPAVLQADGPARRLRQDLRGRSRVPRRPLVHLAARDGVHVDRRGDELGRLARGRHEDARGAPRRRPSPP